MTMYKRERVARDIADRDGYDWDACTESQRSEYLDNADAAIAVDQQKLRQIASAYIAEGEQTALDAGYAGEMSDRGGGAMVREARAFLAGLDGRLPENWRSFANKIERKEADDRAEYERLKAKFGDT